MGLGLILRIILFHKLRWTDVRIRPVLPRCLFIFRICYSIPFFSTVLCFHPVNRPPPGGDPSEHILTHCLRPRIYGISRNELSHSLLLALAKLDHLSGKKGPESGDRNGVCGVTEELHVPRR